MPVGEERQRKAKKSLGLDCSVLQMRVFPKAQQQAAWEPGDLLLESQEWETPGRLDLPEPCASVSQHKLCHILLSGSLVARG